MQYEYIENKGKKFVINTVQSHSLGVAFFSVHIYSANLFRNGL
jgi:hypothetical protein